MRSKAVLILLLLVVVGLPLAIVTSLLGARASLPVTSGDQPGGPIQGRLLDLDEHALAGLSVRLSLIGEDGVLTPFQECASGADGGFALTAPAHRGKYELRAGGDAWVLARRELSFLDRKGQTIEPGPVELHLEPGCQVSVELVRVSERYEDSGRYELRGRLERGAALGLVRPELRMAGEFDAGRIEIGGLPPLEGTLSIFLDNGDALELELDLDPGTLRRELQL